MGRPKVTRAQRDERVAHRNPSGGIQGRRDDELRDALIALGMEKENIRLPALMRALVWIRTGTETARKKWERQCELYALRPRDVGDARSIDGWITVYDVATSPWQLFAFITGGSSCLIKWEFAVAGASVSHGGAVQGSGATKKR